MSSHISALLHGLPVLFYFHRQRYSGISAAAPPPPPSPPPSLLLLALLLGVLVYMKLHAHFHLGPVPHRHETIRRFNESPV